MYLLNKFCCICLYNKTDLKIVIDTDSKGVSFYSKLTSSVPEMCFEEMNDERLICEECCVSLNTVYDFRQTCLRNKPNLITYISQLQTYSQVSGSISVRLEDIKQEKSVHEEPVKVKREKEDNCEETEDNSDRKSACRYDAEEDNNYASVPIKEEREESEESEETHFFDAHFLDTANTEVSSANEASQSNNDMKNIEFVTLKCEIAFGDQVKKEDTPQDDSTSQTDMNADTGSSESKSSGGELSEANIKFAEKSHECEICKKRFRHKGNLTTHVLIHSGEKPYECEICKKRFNHRGNLATHVLIHSGEKPHECEVCKKRFNRKSHLTSHMIIHSSERPYVCGVCNNKYVHESDLNKHMRMHSADRRYECETCMKKFNSLDHLTSHLRIHTGERPYTCEVCDKRYMRKDNLTQHMRLHTGVRPFKCEVCKKGFNQRGTLNTHLLIHTGEKPYECEVCKKRFNNKSNLTTHMVVHLGVLPFVYS